MRINRVFFSFLASVMILISCSEENNPKPFEFSRNFTGKTSKTWQVQKLVLREKDKKDQTLSMDACEIDDLYTFYANDEKLFEVSNGSKKCDAAEDDLLVSYNWSYASANANLTMVAPHIFGNYIIPFIVLFVDNDEMQLEIFLDEAGTISYVLYFKLVSEN